MPPAVPSSARRFSSADVTTRFIEHGPADFGAEGEGFCVLAHADQAADEGHFKFDVVVIPDEGGFGGEARESVAPRSLVDVGSAEPGLPVDWGRGRRVEAEFIESQLGV